MSDQIQPPPDRIDEDGPGLRTIFYQINDDVNLAFVGEDFGRCRDPNNKWVLYLSAGTMNDRLVEYERRLVDSVVSEGPDTLELGGETNFVVTEGDVPELVRIARQLWGE